MRRKLAIRVLGMALLGIVGGLINVSEAQWLGPWSAPVRAPRAISVEFLNDSAETVDVYDRQFFKGTIQPGGRSSFLVWEGDVALFAQRTTSKTWHKLAMYQHQDFIWRLNLPQHQHDRKMPGPVPVAVPPQTVPRGRDPGGMTTVPKRGPQSPVPTKPAAQTKPGNVPTYVPVPPAIPVDDNSQDSDQQPDEEEDRSSTSQEPDSTTGEEGREQPFYTQVVWSDGIKIQAPANVARESLTNAQVWVRRMLANCPRVKQELVEANATVIIFGRQQELTDLPENQGLARLFLEPGIRGMSRSNLAFVAEENLLYLEDDKHNGEGVLVHELAHVIEHIVLTGKLHDRLELAFAKAKFDDRWEGRYASSNFHEYFAELSQMYFGVAHTRKTGGINGDLALRRHDLDGYEMVNTVFSDSVFDRK
jgi:hypothetical protein